MDKNFTIDLTEDMVNYVQRLGMDVDARAYVIDRMFYNHKDDDDTSMFDSVPFKKYSKELAEVRAEYDMAVEELGKQLVPLVEEKVGQKDVKFTWKVDNFTDLKANITILED